MARVRRVVTEDAGVDRTRGRVVAGIRRMTCDSIFLLLFLLYPGDGSWRATVPL